MGFQITGAAVLLVFYGCYFGKMAAQRKKGIRTDQMGREKTGSERAVELAVKAAVWGAAAAGRKNNCEGRFPSLRRSWDCGILPNCKEWRGAPRLPQIFI